MNTLTEQQILKELRELDPFSRQELLDFLAFLRVVVHWVVFNQKTSGVN